MYIQNHIKSKIREEKKAMSQRNFKELMERYERAYAIGAESTEQERAESLQELAQAVVFAVLKRVYDPQSSKNTERETVDNSACSKVIESMKRELKRDIDTLNNLAEMSNNAHSHTVNKDGEIVQTDRDLPCMHERLSDGMELVNTAVLKLLELSADGHTNLEERYTERKLSKRVYIREEDSAKFEDAETSGIVEVFQAVREQVDRSGALKIDASSKTIYLEELATDEESGAEETQYRRLPKKLQRAGDISIKGSGVTLTCTLADFYSVRAEERRLQSIDDMLSEIGATARQAQIIKLREQGRGYKAIATYLGVTQRAIAKNCEGVAKKYIAKYGEPRDKRAQREQEQERREQEQRELAERVSVLRYHAERREQERAKRRAQERREEQRAQERREQREQEQEQNTARARQYFTLRARECTALIGAERRAQEQERRAQEQSTERAESAEERAKRERREREERESAERRAKLERLYLKMMEREQSTARA